MKIAIVDDVQSDRLLAQSMVEELVKDHHIDADICVFDGGEVFLKSYTPKKFDIIVLDIYMYEKTGMDVATYIRDQGDDCKLIFATSSIDFAVESYEVRAIYYVLKPLQKEKFHHALDLCVEKEPIIQIVSERTTIDIPYSKIYWIETFRNTLIIHMKKQEARTYMTFQKLSDVLCEDSRFLVSCKGCIVNMDYISQMDDFQFTLQNDDTVQIRKRNGKQVKNQYFAYICKK